MTTYVPFAPPPRRPFAFQPVLDGSARQVRCTWSLFGQRWFVSVYELTGARVATVPMVASADPLPVASAAWDGVRQRVVVTTLSPHGFVVGSDIVLTFRNFTPTTFDGVGRACTVLDATTLVYASPDDAGFAVVPGSVAHEVNLVGGYFASSLVYRASANRFEVDP